MDEYRTKADDVAEAHAAFFIKELGVTPEKAKEMAWERVNYAASYDAGTINGEPWA